MKFTAGMLVLVVSLVSPLRAESSASTQPTAASKDSLLVKKGCVHPRIDAEGYFEPVDALEVRIRPEAYSGELKIASLVSHGSAVKKGDVLISIDSDPLQRQIAAADSDLVNSQAALVKAQADVELGEQADQLALKIQNKELANAKDALKWFEEVDGKQMLSLAQLQTKNARALVEDQTDELDQLRKMYKSEELTNATADIVVKRALRNLELNKINESMASDREGKTKQFDYDREHTRLALAIEQQTNNLSQIQATQALAKVTRKTALLTAQASFDRATKKLYDLNKDLSTFTVKAPFDGVVYFGSLVNGGWQNSGSKALRIDDRINAGQIVMTCFVPGKLRVIAQIPESRTLWIQPGIKARLIPAADPEASTEGTCGAIVPVPTGANDGGQLFSLPIDIAAADPRIMPGGKASIHIDLPQITNVLTVPLTSVQQGRTRVKSNDGAERWRNVVTGVFDDQFVEIKSGLDEGDALAN